MPMDPQPSSPGDSRLDLLRAGDAESNADPGHCETGPAQDSAGLDERPESGGSQASGAPEPQFNESTAGLSETFLEWSASIKAADGNTDDEADTVGTEFRPLEAEAGSDARPGTAESSMPQKVATPPQVHADRRSLLVIALASYASAATLALIYLYWAWSQPRPHALESLPDVPPLQVEKGEVMKLVPVEAELPPGHTLSLGEKRRFGHIVVEPLRVVAEPLTFEHFSGRADVRKPATGPVLKLWLRFTNVSADQSIAPLDANLLFRRTVREDGVARANQFVRSETGGSGADAPVLVYDHPTMSEWDLSGQRLGDVLRPGESLETYIPSAESIEDLTGPLVWRVHFRKGYSLRGYGVTTLIDVVFNSADIESPAADSRIAQPELTALRTIAASRTSGS